MSQYTSLVEVVTLIFGKKDGKKPITEDLSASTPEQFANRVGQLLGSR